MTPAQIRTIRTSFAQIAPTLPQFGQRFYDRLFAMAPELRALWGGDRTAQLENFVRAVSELVHRRSSMALPAIGGGRSTLPAVADLRRHIGPVFRPEHFEMMRSALSDALRGELGASFSASVQTAWEAAFDVLAKGMLDGSAKPPTSEDSFFNRLSEESAGERTDAPESGAAGLHQFFR
jgi:hemoglobin-like flavoprotein